MTEEELKAALDEAGIEYDGRWGAERLQAALDSATRGKAPDAVTCRVLRDFWPTESEEDRVRKGQIIELTPMDAIEAIEAGAVERVK